MTVCAPGVVTLTLASSTGWLAKVTRTCSANTDTDVVASGAGVAIIAGDGVADGAGGATGVVRGATLGITEGAVTTACGVAAGADIAALGVAATGSVAGWRRIARPIHPAINRATIVARATGRFMGLMRFEVTDRERGARAARAVERG
jgi:hypothetical protein